MDEGYFLWHKQIKWKYSSYETGRSILILIFKCIVKLKKGIPRGQNQRGNWKAEQLAEVDALAVLRVVITEEWSRGLSVNNYTGWKEEALCWPESRSGNFSWSLDIQRLQLKWKCGQEKSTHIHGVIIRQLVCSWLDSG